MNDLEARIQKLERSRGRHRLSIILVSVLLALTTTVAVSLSVVLTGGLFWLTSHELQTSHFRIVDANGNTTVEIGTEKGGHGGLIKTLDASGRERTVIGPIGDNGDGAITLWDGNGNQVIGISGVPGRGAISIRDAKGSMAVAIVGADSQGIVSLYNCEAGQADSKPGVHLAALDAGGLVGTLNSTGEMVATLGVDSSGKGFVAATQPAVRLPAEAKEK